jgi:peroxiredoxin
MKTTFRHFISLLAAVIVLITGSAIGETVGQTKLLQLAATRFNQDISPSEKKLFEAAVAGEDADCEEGPGKNGVIRSDRLSWLCVDAEAVSQVASAGISIVGAEIDGEVHLEWSNIPFPFRTRQCVFKESIFLQNSKIRGLYLIGTHIKDLKADGLRVEDSVFLSEGCKAETGVALSSARIAGDLVCSGGRFLSDGKEPALDASDSNIEGSVFVNRALATNTGLNTDIDFNAEGGVDFTSAKIGGVFDGSGGQFVRKSAAAALSLNGAEIHGYTFLRRGFKAEGEIDLRNAKLDQNLECDGGQFVGDENAAAIDAKGAKIEGSVFVNRALATNTGLNVDIDFHAEGGVDFTSAKIGGVFDGSGGQFVRKSAAAALSLNGAEIHGYTFLRRGFKAEGGIDLRNAKLDQNLECDGGQFVGDENAAAIDAKGAKIEGSVFVSRALATNTGLNADIDFNAEGGVDFTSAEIGRDFDCSGGHFVSNDKKPALDLHGAKVKGSAFVRRDFKCEGGVDFTRAEIGGSLDCDGGQFFGHDEIPALNANSAKIDGAVLMRFMKISPLSLLRARKHN